MSRDDISWLACLLLSDFLSAIVLETCPVGSSSICTERKEHSLKVEADRGSADFNAI